jgi:hypothetical protein
MLRLPSFSHDSTWLVRAYQHFERKCSHITSPATLNLREEVSPECLCVCVTTPFLQRITAKLYLCRPSLPPFSNKHTSDIILFYQTHRIWKHKKCIYLRVIHDAVNISRFVLQNASITCALVSKMWKASRGKDALDGKDKECLFRNAIFWPRTESGSSEQEAEDHIRVPL